MSGGGYGNHDKDGENKGKPNAPDGPVQGNKPNKPQGPDGGSDTQSTTTPDAYPDSDGGKPDYGSPKRSEKD